MQKIPSLFKRDYEGTRLVYDEVVDGSEWVLAGEGIATRKWDGTCCLVRDGILYRRHVVKEGRPVPAGWFHWTDGPGEEYAGIRFSGHGWLPVSSHPSDQYHQEAFVNMTQFIGGPLPPGTYELCGPKVQKNAEGFDVHHLIRHGAEQIVADPRTFDAIRSYLDGGGIEGIVWHHEDGRMVKIKAKDFGVAR